MGIKDIYLKFDLNNYLYLVCIHFLISKVHFNKPDLMEGHDIPSC